MKIACCLLAFDFVRPAVDQQREYIGPSDHRVYNHLPTVETALPHTLAAL
jgi:hypothetical protein